LILNRNNLATHRQCHQTIGFLCPSAPLCSLISKNTTAGMLIRSGRLLSLRSAARYINSIPRETGHQWNEDVYCSQRLAFLSDVAEAENLLKSATLRSGGPSAHQGNKGCALRLAWHIACVAGNILQPNQSGFIIDIYYYSAVLVMLSDPYIPRYLYCVRFQCSLSCRLEHPPGPPVLAYCGLR
jgi:hypothetical protein